MDFAVFPAHLSVYSRTKRTLPAFAISASTGSHLLNQAGWKAELAPIRLQVAPLSVLT